MNLCISGAHATRIVLGWLIVASLLVVPGISHALPAFARQTGQNCVACHAGGQYPELTAYGRLFKLTGYTTGTNAIPLSAMLVLTNTSMRNRQDPNPGGDPKADFPANNGSLIVNTGSVFVAGKLTNNIGGFIQLTNNFYDHLDANGANWKSRFASDNTDIRYADRFFLPDNSDLIVGLSFNNSPGVTDVWNSSPVWGYNIVPGSATAPTAPLLNGGLAQAVGGLNAYAYWKQFIYAEAGLYKTANNALSFISRGSPGMSLPLFSGPVPYWRVALTHDWGPNNIMLGTSGLIARQHDAQDTSAPTSHYMDTGLDTQYQYLLDPHSFTAEAAYTRERIKYGQDLAGQAGAYDSFVNGGTVTQQDPTSAYGTLNLLRLKTSYVYRARYGGSLSWFTLRGSYNSALQTGLTDDTTAGGASNSISGNVSGRPDTRGWTYELFWLPVQYVRVGLQYTQYNRYAGSTANYDGWGRNPKDNDTLFLYLWAVY